MHITNACIHTYVGIHRCTRTHDYVHVDAIVKMQLKIVLTHARKCTYEQPHANRHACPRAHIYAHTYVYALPLSPICMLSLVMSQLRICLQVTINPFLPGHQSTQTRQIICLSNMHEKHPQKSLKVKKISKKVAVVYVVFVFYIKLYRNSSPK